MPVVRDAGRLASEFPRSKLVTAKRLWGMFFALDNAAEYGHWVVDDKAAWLNEQTRTFISHPPHSCPQYRNLSPTTNLLV